MPEKFEPEIGEGTPEKRDALAELRRKAEEVDQERKEGRLAEEKRTGEEEETQEQVVEDTLDEVADIRREQLRSKKSIENLDSVQESLYNEIKEAKKILQDYPELEENVERTISTLEDQIEKHRAGQKAEGEHIEDLHEEVKGAVEVTPGLREKMEDDAKLDRALELMAEKDEIDLRRSELADIWYKIVTGDENEIDKKALSESGQQLLSFIDSRVGGSEEGMTRKDIISRLFDSQANLLKFLSELEDPNLAVEKRTQAEDRVAEIREEYSDFDIDSLIMIRLDYRSELLPREREIIRELEDLSKDLGVEETRVDRDSMAGRGLTYSSAIKNGISGLAKDRTIRIANKHYEEAMRDPEYMNKTKEEAQQLYIKDVEDRIAEAWKNIPERKRDIVTNFEGQLSELERQSEVEKREKQRKLDEREKLVFGPKASEYRRLKKEIEVVRNRQAENIEKAEALRKEIREKSERLTSMGMLDKIKGNRSSLEQEIMDKKRELAKLEEKEIKEDRDAFRDLQRRMTSLEKDLRDSTGRVEWDYFDGTQEHREDMEQAFAGKRKALENYESSKLRTARYQIETIKNEVIPLEEELERRKAQFEKSK